MLTAKTRKVGNSVAISIPSQLSVEPGTEYVVYKSKRGGITLAPKIPNPFASEEEFVKDDQKFWQDLGEEEMKNV
ncbi:MAG TPA: AbrB/MazE/SpoVT family DNA-binding domain-containing protein [Candidatus Tetragenococcus pullicola]|nr:AbrB/MazE/SpoVT family DNA-binding domain-containing protein [Candidatus Tetragenococcus pullicola]